MCPVWPAGVRQRLGEAGPGQRVPPGLLRLLLLQEAAIHRGGVRPGGGPGAMPEPLQHHAGQPAQGCREW